MADSPKQATEISADSIRRLLEAVDRDLKSGPDLDHIFEDGEGVAGTSNNNNESKPLSAGAAGGDKSAPTRARRASTFTTRGGRRTVNAYPLTELELTTLGVIQGASAFFFAISGASLGFWLSVKQSIAFAGKDTPPAVISYWQGLETSGLVAAILFVLLGIAAFAFSGWKVHRIKKETEHG